MQIEEATNGGSGETGLRTWPATLHEGDAESAYDDWDAPSLIVSDGAYGIGGFPGDPPTPDGLDAWYAAHADAWTRRAQRAATLWFWNTERGWARVHPLLAASGWEYVQTIVWDKGVGHVAGNVNGQTIRRLPTVTEICVFYRRRLTFRGADGATMHGRDWMRDEWLRSGLQLQLANKACGLAGAETPQYMKGKKRWQFPPAERMEKMVAYANEHGRPQGRPYYSLDGRRPVTRDEWTSLRHRWTHAYGRTNVWAHPPLQARERYRGASRTNQKPVALMRRIIDAASSPGDIVWEPFGGLCSASVAAVETGRRAFAAESRAGVARLARDRLAGAAAGAASRPVSQPAARAHRRARRNRRRRPAGNPEA